MMMMMMMNTVIPVIPVYSGIQWSRRRDIISDIAQYAGKYIIRTPAIWSYAVLDTLRQASGGCPALCSVENLRTSVHR